MTDGWTIPGFTRIRELGPAHKGPAGRDDRVVLAVDDVTQTRVAIRFLPPEAQPALPMIRRLGRVEDPNVVGVYEVIAEPPALIMELVEDGASLQRILATQGPTGPLAALAALGGTLAGLAAAHQAGVLHGDYKPGSVLVDRSGVGKLIGFGLGIPSQDGTVGEPAYLAPEQWSGAPLDPSADLYAATAVFFECLTGHTPYQGRKPGELARAHRGSPIPVEEVPGPLQILIARGLAKDPAERPASAAEFVGELEDAAVTAYGLAWEGQGRGRLAELAAQAAAAPDPTPSGRRSRDSRRTERRTETGSRAGGSRRASRASRAEASFRAEATDLTDTAGAAGAPSSTNGTDWLSGGDRVGGAHRADGGRTGGGDVTEAAFFGDGGRTGEGVSAPGRSDPVFAPRGSSDDHDLGPVVDSGPSVTFAPRASSKEPRKPRRGMLIVAGAAVGALAVGGLAFTVLNAGGGEGHASITDHPQQSPPAPAGSSTPAAPTNADALALADRIAKAVDLKPTAAFSYHGPGGSGGAADTIDATGVFRSNSSPPGSYDLSTWNPGDKRFAKHVRTLLIGDTGYVLTGPAPGPGAWKQAPAAHTPPKADVPHVYASMASNVRWAGSPPALLALLHAATTFTQQAQGVYTGTSALATLATDPAAGPLWSSYDTTRYQLSYTVRLGPDDLPLRLEIRLDPKGGDGMSAKASSLDFRTVYSRWGRKVVITPPA